MPIPDDSDVEFGLDMDVDRDATPTQTHRGTLTSTSQSQNHVLPRQQSQPRLRKRRSSITLAASPMNAIRSPARTAGAALHLQRHLPPPPPGGFGGSRSRSGSLVQAGELALGLGLGGNDVRNVACESTSLVGRMRSGSVGGLLRPRRGVRKLTAPAVPPPTAPLPALPIPQAGQRMAFAPVPQAQVQVQGVPLGIKAKTRARGLSVVQSERIDEEMKEN